MAPRPALSGALRVGVIGLGFFGRRHARCYAADPAARLVAVCDADAATRAEVADETGAMGALAYSWAWPDGLLNGYRAALEVVGTRSATYLDCADQGFYVVAPDGVSGGDTHPWPEIGGRIAGDLATELSHFVSATLTGTPYRQDYREAFDAIPVLDAMFRSLETGGPADVMREPC